MELTVSERLVLLGILPKEGDFTTLKIIRQLREELSFDEAENAEIGFVTDEPGRIQWSNEIIKPLPIGEKATDTIVACLKKLNDDKKLTDQHFSLYEKFIG